MQHLYNRVRIVENNKNLCAICLYGKAVLLYRTKFKYLDITIQTL